MASSLVGLKSAVTDLSFGGPFDGNALLVNKNFLHGAVHLKGLIVWVSWVCC